MNKSISMPGHNTGKEYSGPSVTGGGCTYATLDQYNANYFGRGAFSAAPRLSQTRSQEVVVVPSYGGVGNNYLQNQHLKQSSCTGYYGLSKAYPNYGNQCGLYTSNLCG